MMHGALKKAKKIRDDSMVYCAGHGEIHANSLNPYGEGPEACYGGEHGVTREMVHRPIYVGYRKGDFPPED